MEWKKLFAIHALFKKEGIDPKNLKFGEVKTADGKFILTYQGDEIIAGIPLMVVTDEGEMPAPEGEHMLEDGRMVIVEGTEGMIKEVKEKAADPSLEPNPAPNPAPVPNPTPEERMSKEEVSRIIEERVRKFEEEKNVEFEKFVAEKKVEFEKQNEIIDGLYQIVKKYSEKPATTPANNPAKPEKQEFSAQDNIKKIGDNVIKLLNQK